MPVDVTSLTIDTAPTEEDEAGADELHEELKAAAAFYAAKQYEYALDRYKIALEIGEAGVGSDHPIVVNVLLAIARTQRCMGDLEQV